MNPMTAADPKTVAYYVEREMADLLERNALHEVIGVLCEALEEYACPGRGACPTPWTDRGCSLGDSCGAIAADALAIGKEHR